MSSTLDVYQPCPCGSGKKIKFCCQNILADMDKVKRMVDAKQHRAALHALESIEKKSPRNSWVLMTKAQMLLAEGEPVPAKAVLETVLEDHPEQSDAAMLYANCCLVVDGYEASIPSIQRALPRAPQNAELAALLVMRISEMQADVGKYLSARQYLTLGLRWVPDELRQGVFSQLIEMEQDPSVFYPLRSVHHLQSWSGGDDENRDFAKATKLAMLGCWDAAARHFTMLAEKHPESAALWHDAALCLAWVGHEAQAAEAFHKSAKVQSAHEEAVEAETLAQLLDHVNSPEHVHLRAKAFTTQSVSRLLTRLSEAPRLARDELATEEESTDDAGRPMTAEFDVLDRPTISVEEIEGTEVQNLPLMQGTVAVFDGIPEKDVPARIVLQASALHFKAAEEALMEAAGSELLPLEDAQNVGPAVSRELAQLDRFFWLPMEGLAIASRRRLATARWNWLIHEVWANAPQRALGGKSPKQAVGDPALVVPLKASICVLDAWTMQREHILDVAALCGEFQVPAPEVIQPTPETEIQSFSAMQLNRLAVEGLTDEQLSSTLNRAMLLAHRRFLYTVLKEAASRPALQDNVNLDRIYGSLVSIARSLGRRDEALDWVRKGQELARKQPNSFELLMSWEMSELSARAEEPGDPEVPALIRRFFQYYGRKVPQIIPVIERLCATFGIEIPDDVQDPQGGLVGAGSTSAGGVWTPGAPAEAPKKLWLPGQ